MSGKPNRASIARTAKLSGLSAGAILALAAAAYPFYDAHEKRLVAVETQSAAGNADRAALHASDAATASAISESERRIRGDVAEVKEDVRTLIRAMLGARAVNTANTGGPRP